MQHFFIFHPRLPKGHSTQPHLEDTSSHTVCKHCRHPLLPLPRVGCLHKACSEQHCLSSPLLSFVVWKSCQISFLICSFLVGFVCVCVSGEGFHPFYYHMQRSDAIFLVLMHIFPNSSCHLAITFCHGVSFKQVSWCFLPSRERIRACLCFCSLFVYHKPGCMGLLYPKAWAVIMTENCESQENASGPWLLGDTGSEKVLMIYMGLRTRESM